MLLLGAVVLTHAGDAQPEGVAVEAQARRGVGDHNSRVIDAEEECLARGMPFWQSLARWERKNFEIVTVRVTKVERLDAARVRVPVRQALRAAGSVLDMEAAQTGIRGGHVAH